MQVLPFVQVRDLAPSASFYSAVVQPLGLRFISANSSSIVFGDTSANPEPIFEVKAIPANVDVPAPRPTRIVLSVTSPSAVSAFHAAARRANPAGNSNILLQEEDGLLGGESRASATDLEENVMEVVYLNPPNYPASYTGSTVRRTQSSNKEVSRILDWNLDVATSVGPARSVAGSAAPSRPGMGMVLAPEDEPYSIMRRSVTMSTIETSPPQQTSKGLSTGAMVGTVLGAVAAGAAVGAGITYALIKSDRSRDPRPGFDAPPLQRRATYPDPYPDHRPRYVEVERTVEKIRYPEQYPPTSNKYPPPAYVTRYSQVGGPAAEEVDDRASRYTTGSRAQGRSTAGSTRQPLMITNAEHRSNVGSQHTESPRLPVEAEQRSHVGSRYTTAKSQVYSEVADHRSHAGSRHTKAPSKVYSHVSDHRSHVSSRSKHDADLRSHAGSKHSTTRHRDVEVETYVSARSEKSASTVRPVKAQSKAPSHYSSATVKPAGPSRTPSHVSARDMPLPGSQADWEDIDDVGSVAPSDSISCVGSRHSKRSHR
ncbi:hypothetical protein HD806DRAFT_253758 [Xylariaceae sp. AK1471]|nr:hypothetical protein HD806DRAFT_253758 [Xylariaceae sp. AK1471]